MVDDQIGDDDPIPLAVAAKILFRGTVTKSSLRTEARKGNLEVIRIANKDFVTKRAVRRMIERCTIPAKELPATSSPRTENSPVTAQEALRWRLKARREGKLSTNDQSGSSK